MSLKCHLFYVIEYKIMCMEKGVFSPEKERLKLFREKSWEQSKLWFKLFIASGVVSVVNDLASNVAANEENSDWSSLASKVFRALNYVFTIGGVMSLAAAGGYLGRHVRAHYQIEKLVAKE